MSVHGEFVQQFLAGRDHDDVFPWEWSPWPDGMGNPTVHGGITTPNGRRTDGMMHPYWTVTGEMWEPNGRLICAAVNAVVARGWRARLARRLLGLRGVS